MFCAGVFLPVGRHQFYRQAGAADDLKEGTQESGKEANRQSTLGHGPGSTKRRQTPAKHTGSSR